MKIRAGKNKGIPLIMGKLQYNMDDNNLKRSERYGKPHLNSKS